MNHRARVWLACALVLALAACGSATRFAYDNAEPVLLLDAERRLAFEGDQRKAARAALARFHAWHRRAELPRYAALFADAADRMRRGLTRADVDWGMQNVRARYATLIEAAVREAMPLVESLDAENVATLERRFAQDDRKRVQEELAGEPAKRARKRVTAIVKRLEAWTGPLDEAQATLVQQFVDATADHAEAAHAMRLRRQRELVALLDRTVRADSAPPAAELRALFVAWGLERTPPQRNREERFARLLLDLDRSLTTAQRARVVERLTAYAEDARVLARGA
jgi:hypothetical protein